MIVVIFVSLCSYHRGIIGESSSQDLSEFKQPVHERLVSVMRSFIEFGGEVLRSPASFKEPSCSGHRIKKIKICLGV